MYGDFNLKKEKRKGNKSVIYKGKETKLEFTEHVDFSIIGVINKS